MQMRKIKRCGQISQLISNVIYVTCLPFLTLSFLYGTIPQFEVSQTLLAILFFVILGVVLLKIMMAVFIKTKVCGWEKNNDDKGKMSYKQLLKLM